MCSNVWRVPFAGVAVLVFLTCVSAQSMFTKVNDFDGDGKADFAVTADEDGLLIWHIWQTTDGYMRLHWGLATDAPASGDYDGDGKTDIAVSRRPFNGRNDYYILESSINEVSVRSFNAANAFFAGPQDYDGDGKSDAAILSDSDIYILRILSYISSLTGQIVSSSWEGASGSSGGSWVRIGDTTGDGRAEATGANPNGGFIYVRDLTTGDTQHIQWGAPGDKIVAGDFDGDNKGDITVYRPSTGVWWSLRSSDGAAVITYWGTTGDIPVPADYDGDGRTDYAIYRPGSPNGIYYINGSQFGFQTFVWGNDSHTVVNY